MRFHVVSLPFTNTTEAFNCCAYTQKVRKFCKMMKDLGHTVFLYAGSQNAAPCDEWITCLPEDERYAAVGDDYINASYDWNLPHWQKFNNNAIAAIAERAQPQDFLCLIAGLAQKSIADAFPAMQAVEYGIGYGGVFSKYRVWESYAWMHTCYGATTTDPHTLNGHFFDTVIPNSIEHDLFPFGETKDDYFLFIGRLVERKGYQIAADVCKKMGHRLIVAGSGTPPDYGEYVGIVNAEQRGKLMSKARAVFVPTLYVEPFGSVIIEALMGGTPVICTDWGAFTETVTSGVNGYRCRMFREFCEATEKVASLNYKAIRKDAVAKYSLAPIGRRYQKYFEDLHTLWGDGWYADAA